MKTANMKLRFVGGAPLDYYFSFNDLRELMMRVELVIVENMKNGQIQGFELTFNIVQK